MKEYEMHVECLLNGKNTGKWVGSELFEAETPKEALVEAVISEYNERKRDADNKYMFNLIFEEYGFGCVWWDDFDGDRITEIITIREWKGGE